jgi:hypothetical protein
MGSQSVKSDKVQIDILQSELMNKKILDVSIAFELKKYLSVIETTNKLS